MKVFSAIFVVLIKGYRLVLSPAKNLLFGPMSGCRFTPSCSAYAIQAIESHGLAAGLVLSSKRILKCHPWGSSGSDPVPPCRHCSN